MFDDKSVKGAVITLYFRHRTNLYKIVSAHNPEERAEVLEAEKAIKRYFDLNIKSVVRLGDLTFKLDDEIVAVDYHIIFNKEDKKHE